MRALAAAGLVMILAGIGAYYATSADALSGFSLGNLVVGAGLLVTAGIVHSRRVSGFSGWRSQRVLWRWSAITGVVLLALVALNVWAVLSPASIDWTAGRRYTLADQTLQVCSEIEALAPADRPELLFVEDSLLAREIAPLTEAYRTTCRLDVQSVAEEEAPLRARQILATHETTVVACHAHRCEPVGYPTESSITNALLRLVRSRQPVIYFNIGHGEVDLASEAGRGYTTFASTLRDEGIEVRARVGPAEESVPEDTDVLIIAAPERDLLARELEFLEAYLQRGGRLLALLDPESSTNVDALLVRWGFDLPPGIVADRRTSPLLPDPTPVSLLTSRYTGWHPITRKLSVRTMLLLPSSRLVGVARKPEPDDELVELVFASDGAWLETDVGAALAGRPIQQDPDERAVALPLAAAGRYPGRGTDGASEARIVVVGERDFASNRLIATLYNRDLLLNAVLWLAEDEAHLAIRPKAATPDQDPLTLQQTLGYFYFLAFALPEVLLLLAIRAWHRQQS